MNIDEQEEQFYEFLEHIDFLASADQKVMIQAETPKAEGIRTEMTGSWLSSLEEKGLVKILKVPGMPVAPGKSDNFYVFLVKERFHDYVDEFYRYKQLTIPNLSRINFLAVLDVAYEIRQQSELTRSKDILIERTPHKIRFEELEDSPEQYRYNALGFLRDYGAIQAFVTEGYSHRITMKRRTFDLTYQKIMTRAVQDGLATYKNDPLATKAIAMESKSRQQQSEPKHEELLDKTKFKTQSLSKPSRVTFRNGLIAYDGKQTKEISGEIEFSLCKLLFKNRRIWVEEADILELAKKELTSPRSVYDACNRLNNEAYNKLGIEKLFEYKKSKFRICKNYR